ncbi:cereblon family protein [Desulfatitalea alkaliphila]|uniref:Cereblon family protein n=1 Tax=Desulfatitalea alkaliphila TaxID=2929485 RepID=A0AA41UMD5_9BACT|nr:cereblon family protein [Desulfatitalea alkaliphila]MCJ8502501.1 cereblon family protein [Desulfatitalea alkaliphila]
MCPTAYGPPTRLLKTESPVPQGPDGIAESLDEVATRDREEEAWYLCRNCRQRLTRPSERIAVNGSHRHTFANPGGVVFEIACFSSVTGCGFMGPPSTDFTWFAGHAWRITVCGRCGTHLGWLFSHQGGGRFWGLIVDRLTLAAAPKD